MNESEQSDVPQFPAIDWCFDIEIYYSSAHTNMADKLRLSFQEYRKFSFRYNGLLTTVMSSLGLIGSLLLLKQIRDSRVFSKRLAVHLGMICVWDFLYLVSCLATYGVPSLLYGMPPSYGLISYILFFLQPFASFCVSCTIWQVVAITVERYWAVTKPLEQRTRKARFGVRWICLAIVAGAFILNLLPVPFERQLVPCFEINGAEIKNYTLLKPYDDQESRLYKFLVHFFPDLVFRAPFPIILIGFLTVKTIQVCNQRTVGTLIINSNMKRNIPLRLSLLNFKFILCNTLYMFNTILLELLGYGDTAESNSNEEGKIERYMNSYYLTDASNMLLVLHSTTNWLLFYHWPRYSKSRKLTSVSISSSVKFQSVNTTVASFVLKIIKPYLRQIAVEISASLCLDFLEIRTSILGCVNTIAFNGGVEHLKLNYKIQASAEKMASFVAQVLKWFSEGSGNNQNIRELSRRMGEVNYNLNLHLSAEQWKEIRAKVIGCILKYIPKDDKTFSHTELSENLTRAFNIVLSEMRNGTLCAAVDANQKSSRSYSTTYMPLLINGEHKKASRSASCAKTFDKSTAHIIRSHIKL